MNNDSVKVKELKT